MSTSTGSAQGSRKPNGFTLIELMIAIATIAVILNIALPVYANYAIRAKISEGLSVAASAKTTVAATCLGDLTLKDLGNDKAGYRFDTGTDSDDYAANIEVSGSCTNPEITVTTQNTGQSPDPILLLYGIIRSDAGETGWRCSSDNTPNHLLPATCRSL